MKKVSKGMRVKSALPSAASPVALRLALGAGEPPAGAITALAGGPAFLWLLGWQQRYAAL